MPQITQKELGAEAFKKRGCPVKSLTFVTYGHSENQASPPARDYTKAFSRKRWNKVPFCKGEVRRPVSSCA